MMNRLVVGVCCLLAFASATAAEVYKWKDSSGKMIYSDTPPMSNIPYGTLSGKKPPGFGTEGASQNDAAVSAEEETSATDPGNAIPGSASAKAGVAPKAEQGKAAVDPAAQKKAKEEKAAHEAAAKKQQEEKLAAEKKAKEQACKSARSRLAQYQAGGRIYRVNEQGEREYIGDKEITVELEQAKNDVEANCE